MKNIILHLQLACRASLNIPTKQDFLYWLQAVVPLFLDRAEITIRLVDKKESCTINLTYRGKNEPTNVLSFPMSNIPETDLYLLGDLLICQQIVEEEAETQKKKLKAHWAHMVVHGVLHLLGYNHDTDEEVTEMERLEIQIMQGLGYKNPYL